jgi:hypothetical protein
VIALIEKWVPPLIVVGFVVQGAAAAVDGDRWWAALYAVAAVAAARSTWVAWRPRR